MTTHEPTVPESLRHPDWQPFWVAWCRIVHRADPAPAAAFGKSGHDFKVWIMRQWADLQADLGIGPDRNELHVGDMFARLDAQIRAVSR